MNPCGEVVTEANSGIVTVNGHSYAGKRSENTNFAILVSSAFTEPFDDPIAYGHYIARLANLLGRGVIIQRPGDLLAGGAHKNVSTVVLPDRPSGTRPLVI